MEKVGIQLVAEGAAEVLRQINSAKQAITEFASAGVTAASNLRIVDTAATGVTQALNALKTRQVEVTQSANQLKTAQIENVQSTNQLKSAQSSEAQELNKLKSSQTELVQSATQLKTAQTEGLQSTNQLKTAQTEEVQELGKLKTAQTEGVQQLSKLKTAQTENVQTSGQLKTAQTQETQELNKLKTAQTENIQVSTHLKTAQIENVQATTQLKTAQAGAVTELAKLRVAQTENVQASTQVKIAEVEETQALTKLKTAQAEAATSLANLRKEQTADAATITELKAKNLELDASLKQTKISTMQQSTAHEAAAKSGSNFGSVTSLLNAKNSALAIGTVAAAKSTLELAAGFDDAMATVQVATGISDRQSESYKRLEAAAREVGGSTKFSATEAAQGLAALSQAGLDADQAITALPAVAQAAQVNNVSLAESAKTVTVAMNAFGLSASDATKIIDLQTTAAAAGILDFNDFKDAIASVGSVAKLSNQSLSETTSVLLALTNNGQSATDAGTSLKSALLALTKPTSSAQAAIDTLGLSIYDSSGKMRPFSDIIAQIEKNTKGMTDEQKNNLFATIAGSDGIRAFSGALNAHVDVMRNGTKVTLVGSEALKEWDKQLDNSSGSTQKAADILGNTFNAQVEKMVGNIQDAAIGVGQKLLPQLVGIVKGISAVIDKIQGFEESTHILTTLTSIGFKPLEGAIIAVNFVFDKAGELVTFLQPWLALLGSTIETKVIPPLKTMGEIAATPFELLDAGLKKIDFGFASSNIDQLKSKIVELKTKTDDSTKANQVFAASISGNRVQSQLAVADLGNMAKSTAQLANTTVNTTKAVTDLTAGIVNVTATPIANGIVAMTKFGDVSGSTTGQLKNVNSELTRLNTLISQSSQEMNDASGKMGTLDKIAQNMSPDVANLWNEWKNYNDKVAEGGVNSDMWSTKAEQVKSKLIALNPKLADVTAAYEIQSEKLKTSTKSFEDNTISMSLNEGKATNLSATLRNETTNAIDTVGKAALDQIPNFESMNRQIQTTPGVTTTAMGNTRNAITAQNFASAAFNVGASVALGIKNGINSEVSAVANAAANLVNQAIGAARAAGRISSPSKEAEEKVGRPIAQGVYSGIFNSIGEVNDISASLVNQAIESMKGGMAGGLAQLGQITKDGVDDINATIGTIPTEGAEAMASFTSGGVTELQGAMEHFNTVSKTGAQKFDRTIHLMPISTQDAIEEIKSRFDKGAGDVQDNATESARQFLTNWSTGVKESVTIVPTTVDNVMEDVNGTIQRGSVQWIKDIGAVPTETRRSMDVFKTVTFDATNAYKNAVEQLGPATQNSMDDIGGVLNKVNFKPQGEDLGKGLMQGIIDGMDSKIDDMIKKSLEAVNKTIEAAKKAGDIHSPSKAMAQQVGLPLMQGAAIGISENAKLPQKAMAQSIGQTIQYPMSAGQMMMQTYNQQSYNNNYNLSLSGMGMSSGNVMSDFAIMQLMGA